MEEKSLRITRVDKSFLNKLSNTITKLLIPTKIGINGLLISVKRNAVIKVFENLKSADIDSKKDVLEKKYEETYTSYLEALDKYVLDSIYKKVKNNTANEFEKQALSDYYGVTQLKESEYIEYKYRKQKYLLELDYKTVVLENKEKILERYQKFYINKIDELYKGILKNYSIKLADTATNVNNKNEYIYAKIFCTLEDYIQNVLPIKFKLEEKNKNELVDYDKYEKFTCGKLDTKDTIEKNMILLGISRKLFTHSLPLVVAEQCYKKLLNDARGLVQDTKITAKKEKVYSLLINIIEDYNTKLLAGKVYWEDYKERDEFKKFIEKYKELEKIKDNDFIEYIRQKEILFLTEDIRKIKTEKKDFTSLIKYYKRKLVDYGVMKEIKSYVSKEGTYKKVVNE